ncbi:sensor histidine kinase [Symbioplanes lichenis]|uniref:sensor histidine kinase n=1 Tax=Symbioplanes lichenis TaxID=1629072 RepID=UPI00273969B9|nr:nitrate- and nitrite sensing domain-containing protein [Actinoplanes lichenis]
MPSRSRSIRAKIIALSAVPLTALLALWAFATVLTAGPALSLLSAQRLVDKVGDPGEIMVAELQRERRLSVVLLATPRTAAAADAAAADLATQRATTDQAVAGFLRTATGSDVTRAVGDAGRRQLAQVRTDLESLTTARQHIDRRDLDLVGAQNYFNGIVDSCFRTFSATAGFGAEEVDRQIRGLSAVGQSREHLSRVDSLLAAGYQAGRLNAETRGDIFAAIATSRFLLAEGATELPAADRAAYQQLTTSAAATRLRELQDELVSTARAGAAVPVPETAWQQAYDATVQQQRTFEINAIDSLAAASRPYAVEVLLRLAAAGLLGLLAVVISVIVSVRIGRSIVGRLVRLRGEALAMAEDRLPGVVRRLQRGESVDVDAETPPLEYGQDEIGQLGQAFTEVQRTAVRSAVEEADVRRGINDVFLNIARRSQTLLHRQLSLLDKMERRETGPDELEDLYRVDHLATRMRRHAEDLVILAGAAPGRGWRNPVPMIDVVRGAISEVEDYKRIDIATIQPVAVLGRAVGDVIHLIAELLENAASFSPPTTRVQVAGQVAPQGYAIEIEDRGLGMSPDAIDEANRKLLEPPDFDPADSARLGLFVVAQLAARQGLRVALRPSSYGGITATVLIPTELVTAAPPGPGGRAVPGLTAPSPAASPAPEPSGGDNSIPWAGAGQSGDSTPARAGSSAADAAPARVNGAPVNGSAQESAHLNGAALARPGEAADDRGITGPTPSTVLDGLSEDGLVQRRRTAPRRRPGSPAEPPAQLPPNLTSPTGLTPPVPSAPPVSSAPPAAAQPQEAPDLPFGDGLDVDWPSGAASATGGIPRIPAQRGPAPISPAPLAFEPAAPAFEPMDVAPADLSPPVEAPPAEAIEVIEATPETPGVVSGQPDDGVPTADERLLPRRVRQASLAPQLRAPFVEPAEAPATRSPEQVRSLMSALQQGTTRGRREAAGLGGPGGASRRSKRATGEPGSGTTGAADSKRVNAGSEDSTGAGDDRPGATDKEQTTGQPSWSEAATVTFPAVDTAGTGGTPDEQHQDQRPEKDA